MSEIISRGYKAGKSTPEIRSEIIKDMKESIEKFKLDEQINGIIETQIGNLKDIESKDFIVRSLEEKGLVGYMEGDKGHRNIDKNNLLRTVSAQENIMSAADKAQSDKFLERVLKTVKDEVSMETPSGSDVKNKKTSMTQEQFDREIENLAKEIYDKYSDIYTSAADAKEQILSGLDALITYKLKEAGFGVGAYKVNYDAKGNKESITINSDGTPIKNLNMPGQWAIEIKEGIKDISRQSSETFIASKEALAAFEWAIGFSGTFSRSIQTFLGGLNYEKGGGAPLAMKIGVTTALVGEQKSIPKVIVEARSQANKDGVAGVDLIITPNSDIAYDMHNQIREALVTQLVKEGNRRADAEKIADKEIISLSLETMDKTLMDMKNGPRSKYLEDALKSTGKEGDVMQMEVTDKLQVLQEAMKLIMRDGEVSYVIADVTKIGRGWNPGKMETAVKNLRTDNYQRAMEKYRLQNGL